METSVSGERRLPTTTGKLPVLSNASEFQGIP
jgi:hypothetical protein